MHQKKLSLIFFDVRNGTEQAIAEHRAQSWPEGRQVEVQQFIGFVIVCLLFCFFERARERGNVHT